MVFMMRVTSSQKGISFSKILAAIFYHLIVSYFIYSVFVYYNIIKRQKKMAAKLALQRLDLTNTGTFLHNFFPDPTALLSEPSVL